MFTGATTQKNSLGEIVMIFSLFLVWDYLERRSAGAKGLLRRIPWDLLILLYMGAWLLYMSDSKTATICLLLGLGLMTSGWLASRQIQRVLLFGTLSVPFLLFFTQEFRPTLAPLVEAMGRDLTFTGRTEIWSNVLSGARVNPLIGAGFFNFWGGERGRAVREIMHTPGLHSAHNGYVDLYLDGGLIGLAFLLLLFIMQGHRLIRDSDGSRYQRLRFAVLIIAILYNLSESTFVRLVPIWYTTLLMLVDFRSVRADRDSAHVAVNHQLQPSLTRFQMQPVIRRRVP
jgi:exopolysaccharide production protein ExoQ